MTETINLEAIHLEHGAHDTRDEGVCLLEAAAWLAGREHNDHPACVSPVLGTFGRAFNDYLPDGPRQKLIPFIARLLNTASDGQDAARLDTLTDWIAHTYAPRWLELAGLDDQAAKMRAMVVPSWAATAAAADAAATAAAADGVADAAAADAAMAVAAAAVADAAMAARYEAARQLRNVVYSCRSAGYRAARVIALRAVTGHVDYQSAKRAAAAALATAVEETQAEGFRLFDQLINPERTTP